MRAHRRTKTKVNCKLRKGARCKKGEKAIKQEGEQDAKKGEKAIKQEGEQDAKKERRP